MRIKPISLSVIIAFFLMSNIINAQKMEQTNSHQLKSMYQINSPDSTKYIYFVSVLTMGCQFEININDVLAFSWRGVEAKSGGSAFIPANSLLLHDGMQYFTVKMYPLTGKTSLGNSYVRVLINEAPSNNIGASKIIKEFESHSKNDQSLCDSIARLPYYEFSNSFMATNLPAQCVGWLKSENLEEDNKDSERTKQLKQELYTRYKLIHQILSSKDITGFMQQVKEREQMLDILNCFDEMDIESRCSEILSTIASSEETLQPLLPLDQTSLQYMAKGRLVTLVDSEGRGIIQYRDTDHNLSALDFRFQRKRKGEQLEIIF